MKPKTFKCRGKAGVYFTRHKWTTTNGIVDCLRCGKKRNPRAKNFQDFLVMEALLEAK